MRPLIDIPALWAREARAQILSLLRTPQFLAPSLLLPVTFYSVFGIALPQGRGHAAAYLLATYAVFAAIGPALFGFGAGVAAEREAGLLELKRVSPLPAAAYIFARLAAAVVTTALALVLIFAAAVAGGVSMPLWRWTAIFVLGAVSAVPFALIGLNLGLRLGAQGATAGANFLFLAFSMLGGLWFPLSQMPSWMTRIAWALPSYHLGALSLDLAGLTTPTQTLAHGAATLLVVALAAAGAWAAWRRENA